MIPKFPGVVSAAAKSAQALARGALQNWIAENREPLIVAIQDDTEGARLMLYNLAKSNAMIAGAITITMAGTPEQAVNSIAMFDAGLAGRLRSMLPEVARLQAAWKAGLSA